MYQNSDFKFKCFIYTKTEFIIILLRLKLINFFFRLSLGQRKWSNMAILSFENIRGGVDFDNPINEFASFKARTHIFSFWYGLAGHCQHLFVRCNGLI